MNFCDFVKNNLLDILIIFLLISILVFILIDRNNNCKIKEGLYSDNKDKKDSWKKAVNVIIICVIIMFAFIIIGYAYAIMQDQKKSDNILDRKNNNRGMYLLSSEENSSNYEFYTPDSK
jgi:ABC-type sugar transport system permease subunit